MTTNLGYVGNGLDEIECELRAGRVAEARERLRKCLSSTVKSQDRPALARLLCRAGLVSESLSLLRPRVQRGGRMPLFPCLEEQVEYAGCLIRLGAGEGAEKYLAAREADRIPTTHFYRAMAEVAHWNYTSAIPSLLQYGRQARSRYQRCVAKVNLAAAFIFVGDEVRGEALLSEVARETSLRRWITLHANALELGAEYFILRRRWGEARRCLESSARLLEDESWIYRQLLMKWDHILRFMTGRLGSLDEFRQESLRRGLPETLRECDRFTAIRDGNGALAKRLYFGTPFEGYRRRIGAETGVVPAEGETYLWHIGPRGEPRYVLDLSSGAILDRNERCVGQLKVGQLRHRVLGELSRDFYRPIPAGRLAVGLYRDERCLDTFRYRIHEAVGSTRSWLRAQGIPLSIVLIGEGYRLESEVPMAVRVCESSLLVRYHGKDLHELRRTYLDRPFSNAEGARILRIPQRTLSRILTRGWEQGHLERMGNGRYTRYRFRSEAS